MIDEEDELYDSENVLGDDDLGLTEEELFILKKLEREEQEKLKEERLQEKEVDNKLRREARKSKIKARINEEIRMRRAAISSMESSSGLITWNFNDQKSRETLTGKIEDKKLFEIKKGITVWTLRILDNNLKENYKKETRHSSHSAFTYQELKKKADKIIDSFWQKDS